MDIKTIIQSAASQLADISSTPKLDIEVLLAHVLQKDRSWLVAHDDYSPTAEELGSFMAYIERRKEGEPLAYILGHKDFYGRHFTVTSDVLTPRPESESFITILRELRKAERIHTAIDIGTGSGCIAITSKLEFPDMYITATDTSKRALAVAAKNALLHEAAVTFKEQDLLVGDKEGYDIVLANLPYVPIPMQHPSIAYEPSEALYSGEDGLDHYKRLWQQLERKHIYFVMTESLESQHKTMTGLAHNAHYTLTKTDGLVQLFVKNSGVQDLVEKR